MSDILLHQYIYDNGNKLVMKASNSFFHIDDKIFIDVNYFELNHLQKVDVDGVTSFVIIYKRYFPMQKYNEALISYNERIKNPLKNFILNYGINSLIYFNELANKVI